MRPIEMSRMKRIAGGILAFVFLAVLLFSAFFLAHEADHDCSGEDCPVCACIRQCENVLRRIGSGAAALHAAILPALLLTLTVFLRRPALCGETPVSRAVRLNN